MTSKMTEYKSLFRQAWTLFKREWGFFVIMTLVILVLSVFDDIFGAYGDDGSAMISLLVYILTLILSVGALRAIFSYIDDKKLDFDTVVGAFKTPRTVVHYFLAGLLTTLVIMIPFIVIIGILAFVIFSNNPDIFTQLDLASEEEAFALILQYVVPAIVAFLALFISMIYISTRLGLAYFLVVDRERGAVQALQESWHATKGHVWKLIVFGVILVLFNILGALVFLIGLFVTMPVSFLAYTLLYRNIIKDYDQKNPSSHASQKIEPAQ